MVLICDTAQIENGISHASKRSVDAHIECIGNLLETHVPVEAHHQHITLAHRQLLDQAAHITVNLAGHHIILDGALGQFLAIKDIDLFIVS